MISQRPVQGPPGQTARFRQQVALLLYGALEPDPEACKKVVDRLRKLGVSPEHIAERHIPEAARQIGKQWMEDETCFADVTIATSKLQALLHYLEPDWGVDRQHVSRGLSVLLMVSAENDHTLGAMVLLGQLRRLGCSVRLLLTAKADTLKGEIGSTRFDAVMISASSGSKANTLRPLVQAVRRASTGDAPIVIGGGILESEPDLLRLTGADYAENDPHRALKLCRSIKSKSRGERRAEPTATV